MEGIKPFEQVEQEIEKKLAAVKETALDFETAQQILEEIESYNDNLSEELAPILKPLKDELLKSSVVVQTLPEFRVLLEKGFGDDIETINDIIAHENAHANALEKAGAIFTVYSLLIAKKGDVYMRKAGANYSYPSDWTEEKKTDVYKQMLSAPEEYGNILSSSDKERLEKLKDFNN